VFEVGLVPGVFCGRWSDLRQDKVAGKLWNEVTVKVFGHALIIIITVLNLSQPEASWPAEDIGDCVGTVPKVDLLVADLVLRSINDNTEGVWSCKVVHKVSCCLVNRDGSGRVVAASKFRVLVV